MFFLTDLVDKNKIGIRMETYSHLTLFKSAIFGISKEVFIHEQTKPQAQRTERFILGCENPDHRSDSDSHSAGRDSGFPVSAG
jgi:hypothetical protein